jgi:gluconokinase
MSILYLVEREAEAMNYIGVDIGTTSTKSIVFDKEGKVLSKSVREYPIYSVKPDYREQDPEEILQAVIETLEEAIRLSGVKAESISFAAFGSMMHGLMAVDETGKPLTGCIIWNDNRSASYVEEYKKNGKGRDFYLRTGTPTHSMSPLYKLMWMRDNEPEIFKRAHKFISIKEYIFYRFFGEYIVDFSVASASGLFNIFDLGWDEVVLRNIGLVSERLSKPVPTTYIIDNLDKEVCKRTGLTVQTKFVIGASDGCLANLGSNAIRKGAASATIGTSGAVRVTFDKPVTDEKERVFCYYLSENKYVVGGAINNGGITYRWFLEQFGEGKKDSFEALNQKIGDTKAGSEGLIFLPFLAGERAPYWNSNLRGAYIGISDYHEKSHFARALLEGICYDMKDVLEAVKDLVPEVSSIYANGGFTRSKEWIQMLCDIFDERVSILDNYESACTGAIMLGMVAVGEVNSLEECGYMLKENRTFEPRVENKFTYELLYKVYKNAVEGLIPVLEQLSSFQRGTLGKSAGI